MLLLQATNFTTNRLGQRSENRLIQLLVVARLDPRVKTARQIALASLIILTLLLVFVAGYGTRWLLSHGSTASPQQAGGAPPNFKLFWEARDILQRDFFGDQPQDQTLTYGAIKGMTDAYGDPYTRFVEPEPRQREREDLSGVFGGIGAYITADEAGNKLLDPMPDRPAEKAGIRKGDILTAVDDKPVTSEMSVDAVVEMIRGPIGEAVALTVTRTGVADPLAISVVRERIETPSVQWRALEQTPQIGYIAISSFTERTASELDRAIAELNDLQVKAVVLDLRHNGGGLLEASIEVASRFLNDGTVVFERRNNGEEQTYSVRSAKRAPNWPMIILVDNATASASEIVAGALQDRGRATLAGDKTFGKGSVQLVYDLSDDSSVHVTVAHWITPNGHEINGVGLTPEQLVPHEDTRDAPLEEAVKHLIELGATQN
ncbi:MAG: S41 family peptidase [Anaerolineae bacterium]